MDPDEVKSKLQGLAFGNVLAAAARDYKKVTLARPGRSPPSPPLRFHALLVAVTAPSGLIRSESAEELATPPSWPSWISGQVLCCGCSSSPYDRC